MKPYLDTVLASLGPIKALALGWWTKDYGVTKDASNNVSAWADRIAAYSWAQATAGKQPVWSLAGLTFDGVDDFMEIALTSAAFPTGSTGCEVFVALDQQSSAAATSIVIEWGGITGATRRSMRRSAGGRLQVSDGSSSWTDTTADTPLLGRHLPSMIFTAAAISGRMDGHDNTSAAVSVTLATGTTRARIGATSATTPPSFNGMCVREIAIFPPLTAAQRASIGSDMWRRG